ncbi:cell division cycle-related protein [Paramarasmius palmivorus]|uniref:Cell division cycle-related protein n=1 Tax=Paramarasmius palmivorus TaxID=297713 RepID=A0AAW0DYR6_9AGAR
MATVTASSYRSNSTFVASSSSTTSTSLQSSNLSAFDSVAQQDSEFDDDAYPLFCRALYDYTAQDTSALSFRKGEIIEILSQQPSGWWDGLLGDERGWFPSNYVAIISEEEAELAFSGSDFSNAEVHVQQIPSTSSQSRQSVVDMSEALMRGGSQEDSEQWLQSLGGDARGGLDELANATLDNGSAPSSEYWMPRVAPSGQIYYVNTRTGQQSRDLPQEADDETSDSDLAGLTSQSSSRSGTSAGLGFSVDTIDQQRPNGAAAGFGLLRRTGTPEPWVKKLADDGMSYYYLNTQDGQVQWTRPEPSHVDPQPSSTSYPSNNPSAQSSSRTSPQVNGARRTSVYSDTSDVHPADPDTARPHVNGFTNGRHAPTKPSEPQLTIAERIAQSLQQALAPPPPELITDLSASAKASIHAVVENIQSSSVKRHPEDDQRMDDLIHSVVLAVRNLLYISAVPTGQIPTNVLPPDARDWKQHSSSHSPLKPAQRKVTATLSRLVLSARAIQYDSGSSVADTLNRIEVDAEELERAVLSFVLEVQRMQHSGADGPALPPMKRLRAVFGTANIGLGLPGAGAAGSWKGFGWVSLDDEACAPQKILRPEVVEEVGESCTRLYLSLGMLGVAVKTPEESAVDQIHSFARQIVGEVSSFLTNVADINIMHHVDIDSLRPDSDTSSNVLYARTVEKARHLVRKLEVAVQSVYDDCSALLLQAQSMHDVEPGQPHDERDVACDMLNILVTSLKANLTVVHQTLEAVLALGHEQSDISQGDYRGSIEDRMSRQSLIGFEFGGALRPLSIIPQSLSEAQEDLVDDSWMLEPPRKKSQPQVPLEPNRYNPNGPPRRPNVSQPSSSQGHERNDSLDYADSIQDDPTSEYEDDSPRPGGKAPGPKGKSNKLLQILGPGAPSAPPEIPPPPEEKEKPWYLGPDSPPEELILDSDKTVKGGTLKALVERLTSHDIADPNYSKAFLMTFKSFTTLDELFDCLVERFRIQPPPKLMPPETEQWVKMKQKIVQARVINTFKSMVTDDDVLEKEDMYILDRIKAFAQSQDAVHLPAAKQLVVMIDRTKQTGGTKIISTNPAPPPPPIFPKANRKLKLLDIEPLELARQLTLLESQLYQKIRPMECLQRAREQKSENMDNIAFVIQTSNRIADWVAESVLSKDDSRRRAATVKHLISVADRCRTLNNFSTMIAIISGLNTPPIRRLKRTWEQVSQRYMAQFGACEVTLDSNRNFNKYRSMLNSVVPPCVPFIGVFLSTLQFIQDGNPDNLPGNFINFKKRQKASEVISDIKRWQAHSFNFHHVPAIRDYIEESLAAFSDTRVSSERFWAMSLEREPREREDEKMARLLQESGFL